MSSELGCQIGFPADPLDQVKSEATYKRRMVLGVLESYNSNSTVVIWDGYVWSYGNHASLLGT